MKIYSSLAVVILALGLSACQSSPKTESPKGGFDLPPSPVYETQERSAPVAEPEENIDYVGLQRSLGLERGAGTLGYLEKSFATCQAGFGYSSNRNCRRETMAVINMQIMCRDSEGTVSHANHDLQPLSRRSGSWTIMNKRASIEFDDQGQGQIVMTFASSPRNQRLRLTVGEDFLYLKAGEVKRIVVPQNWCQ